MKRQSSKSKTKHSAAVKQRTLLDMFPKSSSRIKGDDVSEILTSPSGSTLSQADSQSELNRKRMGVEDIDPPAPISPIVIEETPPPQESSKLHGPTPALAEEINSSSRASPASSLPETRSSPIIIEDTPPPQFPPQSAPSTEASSPISRIDFEELEDDGSSPSAPIVIESSPIKPPALRLASKTTHPFFAPRITSRPQQPPPAPSKSKTWDTPYPSQLSQHVKGPQMTATCSKLPYPTRSIGHLETSIGVLPSPDYSVLSRTSDQSCTVTKPTTPGITPLPPLEQLLDTIPQDHISDHPSISRLVDRARCREKISHSPWEPWTEKWRPRRADEVLGNESSAQYLRSWLLALKLQSEDVKSKLINAQTSKNDGKTSQKRGKKRPRVITQVARGRARKRARTESEEDNDDWIVNDEGEEGLFDRPEDEEPLALPPLFSVSATRSTATVPTYESLREGDLHNTILLAGPPGSGKTASVYACAEELGWEVFEVYPGIGKRNGSSVENLVGEVGKNHLVRQLPQGGHEFFGLASPSKQGRFRRGASYPPPERANGESSSLAQSFILLEEVDILFKEDSNFWPTVVKIIKECKRPVICTCNDLSLVPLSDLPIQRVLTFEPCSPDVTVSYLQTLSYNEDQAVTRDGLERLLRSRSAIPEREFEDFEPKHVGDLRHAINRLQMVLTTGLPQLSTASIWPDAHAVPGPSNDRPRKVPADHERFGPLPDDETQKCLVQLRNASHEADIRSFVDSELRRESLAIPSIEETYKASEDDEIGHKVLFETREERSFPGTYRRDMEMRTLVKEYLQESTELMEHLALETEVKANEFKVHLNHVLHDVCPSTVWKAPLSHLYLDYGPYIKQIAAADEAEAEAMIRRVQEKGGRKTRNSGLTEYVRTIRLNDLGRRGLSMILYEE
ncbi:P-loop containing nucleoside triphosphate hydrolase protein [Coprinopsis marcescibilis]|uniref:P-loop containing nucleoside triphosphate hydrolase protein n=1 Tax=Coprinopsis marcescibilis TaxID=230819 RepID=A0A5C3L9Q2_COPMA|nr:P-loop containing nucleoside triphosphate hydrolase protein [Coprinopsis marcescibilis]